MLTQAIEKLKTEMDQNKNNSYVQVVGTFLLQHLEQNPGDAEKILDVDKSIAKSLTALEAEARKKKIGNVGVLTPAEGFAIALKFFSIETAAEIPTPAAVAVTPAPKPNFDVSLDDLL